MQLGSPIVSFFSHYFVHGGWLPEEDYLLDNVDAIRHIPATIIQGRYDVTTPMKTAWELHKVGLESPCSELVLISSHINVYMSSHLIASIVRVSV